MLQVVDLNDLVCIANYGTMSIYTWPLENIDQEYDTALTVENI